MILPGDIFEARTKAAFPHEKRELPVYFNYEVWERDAVRYVYPPTMKVESSPAAMQDKYASDSLYDFKVDQLANSATVRRNLARNSIIYPKEEYTALRAYYSKLQAKDQENLILQPAASGASAGTK